MKKMPMCPNISFLPTPIGEEMKEIIQERLKNGGGAPKLQVTQEDLDRAICTHRYKGKSVLTLYPNYKKCPICCAKIYPNLSDEDVQNATDNRMMKLNVRMLRNNYRKYLTCERGVPDDDLILFEMNGIRMYTTSKDITDLVKFCKDANYCYDIYCKINTDYAVNMEIGIPVSFVVYDPGIFSPGMNTCIHTSELQETVDKFKKVVDTRMPSLFMREEENADE